MTDVWVCSTCHSINRRRSAQCYKCGAKQEQATPVLADVRTQAAIAPTALDPAVPSAVVDPGRPEAEPTVASLASEPADGSTPESVAAVASEPADGSTQEPSPQSVAAAGAEAPAPEQAPGPEAAAAVAPGPVPNVLMDAEADRPAAPGSGPRLTVNVEADGRIVAEIDGESEIVTLDALQDAAAALARVGGSAIVTTSGTGADARWTAREVARSLRASGVPTEFED